jgi:hypothetical protein
MVMVMLTVWLCPFFQPPPPRPTTVRAGAGQTREGSESKFNHNPRGLPPDLLVDLICQGGNSRVSFNETTRDDDTT